MVIFYYNSVACRPHEVMGKLGPVILRQPILILKLEEMQYSSVQ
jgi:hypothetical protein